MFLLIKFLCRVFIAQFTGEISNITYLYNFGDGSYKLTNCKNVSHVYTRLGPVTIEVSARNNISGPAVARKQFYLKSVLGLIDIKCPEDTISSAEENDYFVNVSQGTLINVTWYWPDDPFQTKFALPGNISAS